MSQNKQFENISTLPSNGRRVGVLDDMKPPSAVFLAQILIELNSFTISVSDDPKTLSYVNTQISTAGFMLT